MNIAKFLPPKQLKIPNQLLNYKIKSEFFKFFKNVFKLFID